MLSKFSTLTGVTTLNGKEQKNIKGGALYCPGGPSYCCAGSVTGPGPLTICGGHLECGFGQTCIFSCDCSMA